MRFHFIHAADLHIDSPLAGLGRKDAAVARRFADAGRRAVERLVDETIASEAAFLLIAGDVFDGDWKDYASGLFFVGQLGRLHRKGIPVYLVRGNHDADSLMSRQLTYPDRVTVFPADRPRTVTIEDLGVVIHGRSFPQRHVPPDFVDSYPPARAGLINIGLLHTSLDGRGQHEAYAPCTAEGLRRFDYQYWALGHIHAAETVSREPWIVFPGNIQGRSVREEGAKGAMRVTVEDGRIVEAAPLVCDAARWAVQRVDVSHCRDEATLLQAIEAALGLAHDAAEARSLAVRLRLVGTTPLHAHLVAEATRLRAEAGGLAARFADDLWVESLRIETERPGRHGARAASEDGLDVEGLLETTAATGDFEAAVAKLIADVKSKLPRELAEALPVEAAWLCAQARDHILGRLAAQETLP